MKLIDMAGKTFGRITVIERRNHHIIGNAQWLCLCQCGTKTVVNGSKLRSGWTKSCGCLQAENASKSAATHGRSGSSEYGIWSAMKARCYNKNVTEYKLYGARGIGVCDRWRRNFADFLMDMGNRPDGMTIDRIENDGNYEPGNCRWATYTDQGNNKRSNRWMELNGRRLTLSQWCRELNIPYDRTLARLRAKMPLSIVFQSDNLNNKGIPRGVKCWRSCNLALCGGPNGGRRKGRADEPERIPFSPIYWGIQRLCPRRANRNDCSL